MKFIGEETFHSLSASKDYVVTASQGFNSTNKFSQARIEYTGKTFYKGAPERLLAHAGKYLDAQGNIKSIDKAALDKKIDELAAKAMRVLAFGYSPRRPQRLRSRTGAAGRHSGSHDYRGPAGNCGSHCKGRRAAPLRSGPCIVFRATK